MKRLRANSLIQAKKIARCAKLAGTTEAVIYDVLAKAEKRVTLIACRDRACRNQGGRVRHLGLLAAAEFDPTGYAVEVMDCPCRRHAPRVVGLVANRDLVLLGWVEVVA